MRGKSVLIVGSRRDRRETVSDAFRSEDAAVMEAMTVHQAEAIVRQLRFDLIGVDFYGLGFSGLRFLHYLRTNHPATCVLAVGLPVEERIVERLRSAESLLFATQALPNQIAIRARTSLRAFDVAADTRNGLPASAWHGRTNSRRRQV